MSPAIQGNSFDIRPAFIGPIIAIGAVLGGAFGAVVSIPAAAAARDVYRYVFGRAAGTLGAGELPERTTA
jgi:predicted PurR-regulated permease PerM